MNICLNHAHKKGNVIFHRLAKQKDQIRYFQRRKVGQNLLIKSDDLTQASFSILYKQLGQSLFLYKASSITDLCQEQQSICFLN